MKTKNILLMLALMTLSGSVLAAGGGGGGGGGAALPWEGGLTAIVASFTGPVAYAVSVLGIIIGIGILIFGNDLNAFGRTIVFLILAASVIVTAANTLTIFTGVGASTTAATLGMLGMFFSLVAGISATQEAFLRLFKKKQSEDTKTPVFA